jgi:hypothetical protein
MLSIPAIFEDSLDRVFNAKILERLCLVTGLICAVDNPIALKVARSSSAAELM